MTATITPTDDPHEKDVPSGGRARRVAAGLVGVLAIVGVLASTLAVWARATIFDSDQVADVVGDALAEPEVTSALAQHIADQILAAVDVESTLAETLPPALDRLAPAVSSGVQGLIERGLLTALQNDDVQQRLSDAVRRAHDAAMRLLQGDGLLDAATVADGQVTLNLLPLAERGLARLQELGLLTDVELPDLAADGDPVEQIAALEATLDRDLPDDFGQLVVYRSETLGQAGGSLEAAQQAMALAKRTMWVLVVVTALLLAATVLIARDRWRATMLLALGAIVAMVIARTATERVVSEVPDVVVRPGAKAAVTSIVGDLGTSLLRTLGIVLVLATLVTAATVLIRRWRRGDLIIVASVLAGVLFLGLLGLTIVSVLLAVVVAAGVAVVTTRFWPDPATA